MRALLVNPWIHDFAAFDFWARPLGLLELGAGLRAGGYEVGLVDCLELDYPGRTEEWPLRRQNGSGGFDQSVIPRPAPLAKIPRRFKRYGMPVPVFAQRLAELPRPDVVLMSSVMTYWWTGVAETIAETKKVWPEVPVVLGGVYASLLPDHARSYTGADAVAAGDFRASLPPILEAFSLPAALPAGDFFPAWDLYPKLLGAAIITGRGCPSRCPYCAVHLLHPRLRRREPEAVAGELERLWKDHQVRDVAFHDDALRAAGDDHLIAILERVIRLGLPTRLHAINALHLRGLSRELAVLMRRAGVVTLRFGLETADPARVAELGDKADLDDLAAAVAHLTAAGYAAREIGVYLLAGLPDQPPAEIETGIRSVLALGARPYLTEFSPVPGSRLWARAVAAARFDLAEPLYHNNTLVPCAHPELTNAELERMKRLTRTVTG